MGPFWGFQEAWLSLSASVFDMAIYPDLLRESTCRKFNPALTAGWHGYAWSLGIVVVACCVWNLRGAVASPSATARMWMMFLSLSPFVALLGIVAWPMESVPRMGWAWQTTGSRRQCQARPVGRAAIAVAHVELHGLGQCVDDRAGG